MYFFSVQDYTTKLRDIIESNHPPKKERETVRIKRRKEV